MERLSDKAVFPLSRAFAGPAVPLQIAQLEPPHHGTVMVIPASYEQRMRVDNDLEWRFNRDAHGNATAALWYKGELFTMVVQGIRTDQIKWILSRTADEFPDFDTAKAQAEEEAVASSHGRI